MDTDKQFFKEELRDYDNLIGLIYEGATNPALWTNSILPALSRYLNAGKCVPFTPMHIAGAGGFCFMYGISQESLELRMTKFKDDDVWTNAVVVRGLMVAGNVTVGTELVTTSVLRQTRWYKEFLRIDNLFHALFCVIFGEETSLSMPIVCSLFRGEQEDDFTLDEKDRLKMIVPHLSRSLGVMDRLNTVELRLATTAAALDRLSSGVLILDDTGEVVFANHAALAMINANDGLRLQGNDGLSGHGKLLADDPVSGKNLLAAMCSTMSSEASDIEHFSHCVIVRRHNLEEPYLLQFSALGNAAEFEVPSLGNKRPAAIVFVSDSGKPSRVSVALLKSAYHLTVAEANIANAMLSCGNASELSEKFDISANTVRTHIKQIYAKLGVDNRARFSRLMMGLSCK